ncbi:uncharacterized protein TNCV_4241251 [Trichonephila clavipes]|nr:uncharacterized protein TNCV_4241251 [Trichonephila clavipes]
MAHENIKWTETLPSSSWLASSCETRTSMLRAELVVKPAFVFKDLPDTIHDPIISAESSHRHPVTKCKTCKLPNQVDGFYKKRSVMSHRKQPSAFDQVSEFDRRSIVAYQDCGLSFREIGSRVGRNQTTVMRICDRWMQEGMTDRRGR